MFNIKQELKKLPLDPGVYIMKDKNNQIIYIGKAKVLKNRVRSYFQKSSQHNQKTLNLIENIVEFEYIVTNSELEALVLENNLIKENKPKYNILLKDDREHPFIKITKESFPRIVITKKFKNNVKNKGEYFGPYTNMYEIRELIELIHNVWPIRECNRVLPRDIDKQRPCLNAHIQRCLAPCSSSGMDIEQYSKLIEDIKLFLNGKHTKILEEFHEKMMECSDKLDYERAADFRDKINLINKINDKRKMEGNPGDIQDVIGIATTKNEALVQVFFIRGGKITGREYYMLENNLSDDISDILTDFVTQYYSETTFIPKEIIVESNLNDEKIVEDWLKNIKGSKVIFTVPVKGSKLKLIDLAKNNAKITLEQFGEKIKRDKEKTEDALKEIANALCFDFIFSRIESYDISNTQGYESVASMVVFEDGKPKRSDYRKFRIKTIVGADDYGSIEEVITRRFERYKMEINSFETQNKFNKLPDVIFIDGGKGQVTSVLKVLKKMNLSIPVCGMIKDDRHRTRGLLYKNKEITMPFTSEGFKLVTRIQDETHRFAIEYHKKLRAKAQIRSVMDNINGIGEVRRTELMKHFKDINKIKNASLEEIMEVSCMDRKSAEALYLYFRKDNV